MGILSALFHHQKVKRAIERYEFTKVTNMSFEAAEDLFINCKFNIDGESGTACLKLSDNSHLKMPNDDGGVHTINGDRFDGHNENHIVIFCKLREMYEKANKLFDDDDKEPDHG